MAPAETVSVAVVYCAGTGQVDETALQLRAGSTLAQAVAACGVLDRHALQLQQLQLGIWGRMQAADTVLRERDRVELYRPLQVDPKEARRLRYGKHKAAALARKALSAEAVAEADVAAAAATAAVPSAPRD